MIDQMVNNWGLPKLPVVADCGYGDCTAFRLGLAERGLSYIVEVDGTTSAYPHDAAPRTPTYGGRGRPPRQAGEVLVNGRPRVANSLRSAGSSTRPGSARSSTGPTP